MKLNNYICLIIACIMNVNPFFLSANIPDNYFCDRLKETEKLISLLLNGNNITLISPRRMGKSGLINHVFSQQAITKNFATVYIDILQTSSLRELTYLLGKAIYDNILPKTSKWITKFFQIIKSINGKLSFDPVTGYPSFNIMLAEMNNPLLTLEEIFEFIKSFNKPIIIAIDEFQQITRYPEGNTEALLRSYIQQQNNTRFIFSGSERHIMQEMFTSYSRPFYNSTSLISLEAIPKKEYVDFALSNFTKEEKKISSEAVEKLYDTFSGYTYYLQKILNVAYSSTPINQECNLKNIKDIGISILEENSTIYREILSNIPERQKELLYAIAIEGKIEKIVSTEFIKKYNLLSASSVQSAARVLLEKDYITKLEGEYSLTDKFFSLWIKRIYGPSSSEFL